MNDQFNSIEIIEKYLLNRMTPDEKVSFEKRIAGDKQLSEQVDFQRVFTKGVANNALRLELNDIHQDLYGGGFNYSRYLLLSLITFVTGAAIWWFMQPSETSSILPEPSESKILQVSDIDSLTHHDAPLVADSPTIISKSASKKEVRVNQQTLVNQSEKNNSEKQDYSIEIEATEKEVLFDTEDNDLQLDSISVVDELPSGKDSLTPDHNLEEEVAKPIGVVASKPLNEVQKLLSEIFFSDHETHTQVISDPKRMTQFTAKNGTFVSILPNSLVKQSGKLPTGNVRVEVDEYEKPYELLMHGLPTVSDGKLLETGGVVNIRIVDEDNDELVLRSNSQIGLSFKPQERKVKDDYATFYGEMEDGIINWKTSHQEDSTSLNRVEEVAPIQRLGKGGWKTNTDYREKKKLNGYINLEANGLGWINCDRFYDKETKNHVVQLEGTPKNALVAVVFQDIKSVLSTYSNENLASFNAPANEDIWIVGIGSDDTGNYYFIENTNTKKLDHNIYTFQKASKWKIKQALAVIQFAK